jgi:hypothetical protein
VDTLILKGGADVVTAGEQAEYLFEKALEPGHRAFIEFPGVGHVMNHQLKRTVTNRGEKLKNTDALDKAISDFKKIVQSGQTEDSALYKTVIKGVEQLQVPARSSAIGETVMMNRWELILAFVNSAKIPDFAEDKTAEDAIKNLGGCLRTEDKEEFRKNTEEKEEFSECICKLIKGTANNEKLSNNEELSKCIANLQKVSTKFVRP